MANNHEPSFADRFTTLWLATVTIGATVYLGSVDQLSSDAVAGILGAVIALAGARQTIRRAGEGNHTSPPPSPPSPPSPPKRTGKP